MDKALLTIPEFLRVPQCLALARLCGTAGRPAGSRQRRSAIAR